MNNNTLVFAHLSDPHLSSLEHVRIRDLLNKRALGYLSWKRHRRREHLSEVLAALVCDLNLTRPDHVVVTGDLTHLGLPSEFRQVRQWLDTVGTPKNVTVVPGNHDAYVHTPWVRTFALWAPYMNSDIAPFSHPPSERTQTTFPSLRIRGPVAFIGLSTARPSAPFFATGSLGRKQLEDLGALLAETGRKALFRTVLIHHPPTSGTMSWRKRLTDRHALRSILAKHGVELVLHGHSHRSSLSQIDTRGGHTPVIGVPSASAIGLQSGRRAQYHIYQVTKHTESWNLRVDVRGYFPEDERFVSEAENELKVRLDEA